MHWAERHIDPMLALRYIICSDRWKEEWPKIEAGIRKQKLKKPAVAPSKIITGHQALLLILQEKLRSEDDSLEAALNPKKTKTQSLEKIQIRQHSPKL